MKYSKEDVEVILENFYDEGLDRGKLFNDYPASHDLVQAISRQLDNNYVNGLISDYDALKDNPEAFKEVLVASLESMGVDKSLSNQVVKDTLDVHPSFAQDFGDIHEKVLLVPVDAFVGWQDTSMSNEMDASLEREAELAAQALDEVHSEQAQDVLREAQALADTAEWQQEMSVLESESLRSSDGFKGLDYSRKGNGPNVPELAKAQDYGVDTSEPTIEPEVIETQVDSLLDPHIPNDKVTEPKLPVDDGPEF